MVKTFADELEEIGSRWIEAATDAGPPPAEDTVYHYTDAAGLNGMLVTGTVWLTNYRFLNDKTEVTHTENLISEAIGLELRNKPGILKRLLYTNILDWQKIPSSFQAYVMSFSEERDDLSQWRGYARDGEGFTIGFSAAAIKECLEKSENYIQFSKIEYDRTTQLKRLLKALNEIEDALEKRGKKAGPIRQQLVDEAGRHFDWIAGSCGALNKHHSFRSEKEWRLVAYVDRNSPGAHLPARVRPSGNRLVPYVEVNLCGLDGKLPIKRIGVGPGFSEGAEGDAVRLLCRLHDYNPEIYFADTPYRRPDRIF